VRSAKCGGGEGWWLTVVGRASAAGMNTPRRRRSCQNDYPSLLVGQVLGLCGQAFTEDPVGIALIDQNDGDENQGDDGHDLQRVRRGGSIVNGQTVVGVRAGDHDPRVQDQEKADLGHDQVERRHDKGPAFQLAIQEETHQKQSDQGAERDQPGIDPQMRDEIRVEEGGNGQQFPEARRWFSG